MKRWRVGALRWLGIAAAVVVCLGLTGCGGSAQSEAREAFEAFDAALRAKDLPALRGLVVKSIAIELDQPNAATRVAAKAAEWPGDILVQGVRMDSNGTSAVVLVKGMLEGVPIGGTIQMELEEGRWKVAMEDLVDAPALESAPTGGGGR